MKKEYEAPKAEKMDFDYKEAVVASDTNTTPDDDTPVFTLSNNCYSGKHGPVEGCRSKY